MLKDEATILQNHDKDLLREEFRQNLVESVKAKKESREVFLGNTSERRGRPRFRSFDGPLTIINNYLARCKLWRTETESVISYQNLLI